jgi:hypothetical protein
MVVLKLKHIQVLLTLGPGLCIPYSDTLRAGRLADRISFTGEFSAAVKSGPEAQTASYTMCSGSSPGLKRPGRVINHLPPSSAEVKEGVEVYTSTICAFVAIYRVRFIFTLSLLAQLYCSTLNGMNSVILV